MGVSIAENEVLWLLFRSSCLCLSLMFLNILSPLLGRPHGLYGESPGSCELLEMQCDSQRNIWRVTRDCSVLRVQTGSYYRGRAWEGPATMCRTGCHVRAAAVILYSSRTSTIIGSGFESYFVVHHSHISMHQRAVLQWEPSVCR
jgi:hypothetical protein